MSAAPLVVPEQKKLVEAVAAVKSRIMALKPVAVRSSDLETVVEPPTVQTIESLAAVPEMNEKSKVTV